MNIEERFEKLMLDLKVNDYRVYHEDIITGERTLTFRGATILAFIKKEQEDLVREIVCVEENNEGVISRYVIERKYADEQEGELGYRRIIAKSKGINLT